MLKQQDPDRIIQGIKSIISKNRYSLSKEDLSLLEECINELKNYFQLIRKTVLLIKSDF